MATQLMTRETAKPKPRKKLDPTISEIIAAGRAVAAPARGAWMLGALSGLLMYASFTPLDWGTLGWVCLVPLMLLIRIPRRTRWMYTGLFATAFAARLCMLQWMRLGDAAMYPAWFALAFYTALYVPVFVGLSRVAVHRLSVPLVAAAPVVWVGLEYVQAHLMTGFSWYYLAHTQHHWIELIQISDLVGAYGVSFVVAMTAACIGGLLPGKWFDRFRLLPVGHSASQPKALEGLRRTSGLQVVCCLTIFAAVLGYGFVRRGQADFVAGPRVGVAQANFITSLKHDPASAARIYEMHNRLTGAAVRHQPDLIIWPETMFRWPLFEAAKGMTDAQLEQAAPRIPVENWRNPAVAESLFQTSRRANAALLIGIDRMTADADGFKHYNSAQLVTPEKGLRTHYDKLHRVPFGEYIPLRDELPWLGSLTPFSDGFGIEAGEGPVAFGYRDWRFAPIICFEDTVPHLVNRIVAETSVDGKPVDCLVNLTNDGWFHGSSELDQHLITARFRCIETRTPMVRAVNTGISAVIDGDGGVVEPDVFIDGDRRSDDPTRRTSIRDPKTGRFHKQLNAAIVDSVPLDSRSSAYVAGGDWFSLSCCAAVVCFLISGCVPRRKQSANDDGVTSTSEAS